MMKYIQCVVTVFLLISGVNKVNAQYQNTTIYTPANTSVTAGRFVGTDYTSAQKNDVKNYWLSIYNNRITYQGEATHKYNCHAYAWHVFESGSQVWINTPEQKKYWNDYSYVEVLNPAVATKVSFGGPCYYWDASQNRYIDECDHSAVTTSTPDYFISKWGPSPLFRHHKNDCPYSIEDLHYYTRLTLSGPTLVLNAGSTYTLSGGNGTAVTWTHSPSLQKLSSNNTSITVKPNSDAAGWIQASVGGTNTRYDVWAGKPVITSISGTQSPITYQPTCYTAHLDSKSAVSSINGYEWVLHNPSSHSLYQANQKICEVVFHTAGMSYLLKVRATNANGTGAYSSPLLLGVHDPSPSYRVYPNPVSGELTVTNTPLPAALSSAAQTPANPSYTVYLHSDSGTAVRQSVTQTGEVRIDVSGLPDGIYYLVVDAGNGTKPETHKIIVKH